MHADYREFDCEHLPLFAAGKITRCTMDRFERAVWKSLGVEAGGFLCAVVIP
jgi:hypothetical protein